MTFVGNIIAICGRESYYIMAFHLLGFKVGTMLLSVFGFDRAWDEILSPAGNLLEWLLYIALSIIFSLLIAHVVAYTKNKCKYSNL